ncbi:MAG TPA: peptide deformylase, partial [Candidatus Binatia bacterium]|nr:peptide deformylase [Candidatus Binatia bacterium]
MAEVEGEIVQEELDAERAARRRLALAQIRQYPDAALRLAARPVETYDDELRELVERMKALMHDAVGVGLAGTQVGVLKRLFVCTIEEGRDVAIVNPTILERSDETNVSDEGCLSLQGVLVPVERNVAVTIA